MALYAPAGTRRWHALLLMAVFVVAGARLWTVVGEPARAEALRADARTRFSGDPSLVWFQPRR